MGRAFVTQDARGRVGCMERPSIEKGVVRRLFNGLKEATVLFFPGRKARDGNIRAYVNSHDSWRTGRVDFVKGPEVFGNWYEATNVTGRLTISW
jgi:hypothetical protein